MPMAELQNKTGNYITPDLKTGQNALASVRLPTNLRAWVTDPTSPDAYPIVTYTWTLFHEKYQDPRVAQTLKSVVLFGLSKGQTYSAELGYIQLPESVITDDKSALDKIS
jgi:phosphate transport system substrate-binding protein